MEMDDEERRGKKEIKFYGWLQVVKFFLLQKITTSGFFF